MVDKLHLTETIHVIKFDFSTTCHSITYNIIIFKKTSQIKKKK